MLKDNKLDLYSIVKILFSNFKAAAVSPEGKNQSIRVPKTKASTGEKLKGMAHMVQNISFP